MTDTPRTIATTGATGFVGSETLDQLLREGFSVRALTRRPQPEQPGLTWIMGSLDRPDSLDRLMDGADAVLHIAGVVNAPNRAGFETGNGIGTTNVINAMKRAGVRRLVHVSSLAARERTLSDYCWSKALAEDHVRASGLDWAMVRPPAVYGPRDTEFRELLRVARHGILPVPPAGRTSLIHVRDLARLLLLLCSEAGSGYHGTTWEVDDGTPRGLSHADLAAALEKALGRAVHTLPLPKAFLMGIAFADKMVRGHKAKLTPDRVRYMCHSDWVASAAMKPPPTFWKPQITPAVGLSEIAAEFRR